MNRLLVVRCPELLDEDEGGVSRRRFTEVVEVVGTYCPWVTTARPGVCSLPARGPARYFGGEDVLVERIATAAGSITVVEVGVADGLFAAMLAACHGAIVPPGGTPDFLAPFPITILGHPDLVDLLRRMGIRTVGDFAALPEPHVLGRFGNDGIRCHRVACGRSDELDAPARRRLGRVAIPRQAGHNAPSETVEATTQPEFWGGVSDLDTRAGRTLAAVQSLLGPDGVVKARLQGGRGPAQRARFIVWDARDTPSTDKEDATLNAPWPGQIPPPAPVFVHPDPLPAKLADAEGCPVTVTGRGLLTAAPGRLSVVPDLWSSVDGWAGPWPSDERWWSLSRRRGARLQAVTGPSAHLLVVERGQWWVEATYG